MRKRECVKERKGEGRSVRGREREMEKGEGEGDIIDKEWNTKIYIGEGKRESEIYICTPAII